MLFILRRMSAWYEQILDYGIIPDTVVRMGIRTLLDQRLRESNRGSAEANVEAKLKYVKRLKEMPIAINTQDANRQHYEVPTEFYQVCLGARLKYSSALFPPGCTSLNEAENHMFETYCNRAQVKDGLEILDLGCGWGSLSLYLAEKYPNAKITGLSNSATQREHIMQIAQTNGFKNLQIVTSDINVAELNQKFDRIMSIEMFEHMKNYQKLLEKVSSWMKDDGMLFIHIFTHKEYAYDFAQDDGWMATHFFTGGTMPSDDLLLYFQDHVTLVDHWFLNGTHYGKTSEAWLVNTDKHSQQILRIFEKTYGKEDARMWLYRWRIFFLSCAELFNYKNGDEWGVSHYLFKKC